MSHLSASRREYNRKYRLEHLEYYRDKAREWRAKNAEKSNEMAREYRTKNPEKVRSFNLKKKHGITLEQFDDLFNSQEGKCAICREESSTGRNWHVDHCHQTKRIRGILCHSCNLMIGQAKDKTETLLAAVKYLSASKIEEAS